MGDQGTKTVKRRRVFYIPGYDPFPPRRYRELYRSESALQAEISGYDIQLVPRQPRHGGYGWGVEATIDGEQTQTEINVLVWSDIVRKSMSGGIVATYVQLLHTAWIYISTGALGRLVRLRKGPVLAAFYPVTVLLLQLAFATALAIFIARWGGQVLSPRLGLFGDLLSIAVSLILWFGLMTAFKKRDGKVFAHYLMHDFAHAAKNRGATSPELETRIAAFAEQVTGAMKEDVDEVLVVGHSSGAHLGVSMIADLFRADSVPEHGPELGLLTLGQVVPMVSFLPAAHRLRADLYMLAGREDLAWVDVSAPADGCSFALCDPVAVTGASPTPKTGPLVISAAFSNTLSPERLRALRWRFFRRHFQYLCAFDRPGDYDYFQITGGPMTLGQRFAGRAPSPSRIERMVNIHTSLAP